MLSSSILEVSNIALNIQNSKLNIPTSLLSKPQQIHHPQFLFVLDTEIIDVFNNDIPKKNVRQFRCRADIYPKFPETSLTGLQ